MSDEKTAKANSRAHKPPKPVRKDGTPTSLVGEAANAKTGVRARGSWRKPVDGKALEAFEVPATSNRLERVAVVADALRELRYRSAHCRAYAKAFGMTEESTRHVISEAHRRVAAEVGDTSRATATVVSYLEAALVRAWESNDLRAVGDLSRTWSTIVGAVAPARVQVTALTADLGKLSSSDLQARAAELADAVGRRLALAGQSTSSSIAGLVVPTLTVEAASDSAGLADGDPEAGSE